MGKTPSGSYSCVALTISHFIFVESGIPPHLPRVQTTSLPIMKISISSICFLFLCVFAWAQSSLPLRGTLTIDGEPAIGARIVLVGTDQGTFTDQDGRFALNSPIQEGRLSISLFGTLSQLVEFAPDNSEFVIELVEQAIELDKVEIIGYRDGRIHDPVCSPCRQCYNILPTPLMQTEFTMSDPAILNGRQSQLSISRRGDDIQPRFAQAPLGQQASLSFNGMPLDQKAGALFLFLWESNPQQVVTNDPIDAISELGAQAIGGNISFNQNYIPPRQDKIRYQGLAGMSFPAGGSRFSHQEHHLRLQRAKAEQKLWLQGGIDYVSRPNYQSDSQWELYAGQLQSQLRLSKVHWRANLLTGSLQADNLVQAQPSKGQQLLILNQQIRLVKNAPFMLRIDQLSQISSQNDSSRQYHALRAHARYQNPNWKKLNLNAQYDYQYQAEQQVQAFTAGASYSLPKEVSLNLSARQEQYRPQQENNPSNASLIRASVTKNEDRCAPSRASFGYETAVLFVQQNRVWLNSLEAAYHLNNRGSLWLSASLHANRFAERESLDLCWLQWDGSGKQTQIGGSLSISANHRFKGTPLTVFTQTSYSFNRSIIDPFETTSTANSRQGAIIGQVNALSNMNQIPRGLLQAHQRLSYERWSLQLNSWGWLHNEANSGLANGIRLQEARLSWNAPAGRIYHKIKRVKCSLQGNNLLQWTDGNHQDFEQLARRFALDSFNPMASSRQLLLGVEMEL